ncbi:MAG: AglZ/HisF2 family acetamidino modification protein [Candidatus Goldbacteria bacterium]|nr:AglZ/HisF2 family acetamidino modification protein [Candidatus Goldiibacteriota bacterium]
MKNTILPRIIPAILIKKNGVYKGVKFKQHQYVGDPINTVKIFNDKRVDELIILNIENSLHHQPPDIAFIQKIASEAFMPLAYGGGIKDIETAEKIFQCGIEKIILNTHAFINPNLISDMSKKFGSQSIAVSIDMKRNWRGHYDCYIYSATKKIKGDPLEWALKFESLGAGEIILNSIDRDGTMSGYDLNIIKKISEHLKIPVVALGGAGNIEHFILAFQHGAHACSAGSMFVFWGSLKGILINYINEQDIKKIIQSIGKS